MAEAINPKHYSAARLCAVLHAFVNEGTSLMEGKCHVPVDSEWGEGGKHFIKVQDPLDKTVS